MNIAVVDDEKVILDQISGLVRKQMPDCCLDTYATGEEVLGAGKRLDIVFLDIQMDGMDGIETARRLRERQDDIVLIFVTGNREYIPWSGKFTGKGSNGVFIHEDGTGGYYLDFGWEDDEEEKPKSKKTMLLYVDSSEIKNLNISAYNESDHAGFQTEVLLSLVGANFNIEKKKGGF